MGVLSKEQLQNIGFKSVGENVFLSDKVSIYGAEKITIGNNVRIDDFVVLSAGEGGIDIGNYIHIAVFSSLIGAGRITLNDFCNISSKVSIYSASDDYSGEYMTNPMVPQSLTNVYKAPVVIGKHVIVGSGTVVLPGIEIQEGVAVGALSLVNQDCDEYSIYAGVPIKKIKERSKKLISYEDEI